MAIDPTPAKPPMGFEAAMEAEIQRMANDLVHCEPWRDRDMEAIAKWAKAHLLEELKEVASALENIEMSPRILNDANCVSAMQNMAASALTKLKTMGVGE